MAFYKLTESRVKRVLQTPARVEEGIAPKTIAAMQPGVLKTVKGVPTWNHEIWVMVSDEKGKRRVVSAWRYPGRTKPRDELSLSVLRREYDSYVRNKE